MPDKRHPKKQGFGKYTLINELKDKYKKLFDDSGSGNEVSSILYLEGIHFNLMYFPLQHLGYKSVINAIADLYCRSIIPVNISVNLGLSARFRKEDIGSIIQGISLACDKYSIKISALDISSSLTGLAISIASYGKGKGQFKKEKPEETDLICVTGDLGSAYLGLQLLERERKVFEDTGGAQPKLEGFEYVIGRQLKPELKTELLDKLREENVTTGVMRVVRDGLASELIHISRETGLGCRVYNERLPVDPETEAAGRELGFEPVIAVLNGGDDFEFIFTAPVNEHAKINKTKGLHIIGHLVKQEEGYNLVLPDGSLAELSAQGWNG
ncbi:MAG: thiamine-monophosphate kinase [Bacteroidales bacterium]|nr:thiamine-monophosphate kinase [Bacteroidales bacterium]